MRRHMLPMQAEVVVLVLEDDERLAVAREGGARADHRVCRRRRHGAVRFRGGQ